MADLINTDALADALFTRLQPQFRQMLDAAYNLHNPVEDRMITKSEAMNITGFKISAIDRRIKAKTLTKYRVGKSVRLSYNEVKSLVKKV